MLCTSCQLLQSHLQRKTEKKFNIDAFSKMRSSETGIAATLHFPLLISAILAASPLMGTPHLVKDINPGLNGSFPHGLRNVGGQLYFIANDTTGAAVWSSDGTEIGTRRIASINDTGEPQSFTVSAGRYYFTQGSL